jgi:uncharacterized surface protein with fasciclin (FAS1) repeats
MASDPRLTGWVSLLQQSGLAPYARGATPYTVFAPTNAAINQRPDIRDMLLPSASEAFPDISALITLVRAHVAYGLHPLEEFQGIVIARRLRRSSLVPTRPDPMPRQQRRVSSPEA